jgi:hypothetical protein
MFGTALALLSGYNLDLEINLEIILRNDSPMEGAR